MIQRQWSASRWDRLTWPDNNDCLVSLLLPALNQRAEPWAEPVDPIYGMEVRPPKKKLSIFRAESASNAF